MPAPDVLAMDEGLFQRLRAASAQLPPRLKQRLRQFRANPGMDGSLLIRHLPLDAALPPTPVDGRPSAGKKTRLSELNLFVIMMHLGEPIAYEDEKAGALVQDICPVRGHEHKQENSGNVFLEFHTEDGFHPCKPDHLALICLRGDPRGDAETLVASIRRALPLLPASVISELRRPVFRIRHSASFLKDGQPQAWSPPLPVLSGEELAPHMCVDFHAMEALERPAAAALSALEETLIDVRAER
ncbi:MAG TPA: hypothetical protein VNA24_22400, partial [Hyalangium sp.]|nr:hypothetical protein [Hyalangium sp.]